MFLSITPILPRHLLCRNIYVMLNYIMGWYYRGKLRVNALALLIKGKITRHKIAIHNGYYGG